jgi:hypothetical protein
MQVTIQSNSLISKGTQSTAGIPVAKLPQETNWLMDFLFPKGLVSKQVK